MGKYATIYDICDKAILKETAAGEAGKNLWLIYLKTLRNPLLKFTVLRWCRHPAIPKTSVSIFQQMISTAMRATQSQWNNRAWIKETFKPLADLLDIVPRHDFNSAKQLRHPTRILVGSEVGTSFFALDALVNACNYL